jgi:hypothetical protein
MNYIPVFKTVLGKNPEEGTEVFFLGVSSIYFPNASSSSSAILTSIN